MISTISVMWRLNMLFGPCVMTLCYHIWLFLLQCADLSLYLGVRPLYFAIFAIAFWYSSISTLGIAVLLLWFVIFIACVSLWCFVKVTCSSAWHSETSFGQDKLFPAKIIIMLICFRVLENLRNLFQPYTWLQINMAPVSGRPPELTKWVLDFFIAGISLNDPAEQERLPSLRYVNNHFLFDTSVFSLA